GDLVVASNESTAVAVQDQWGLPTTAQKISLYTAKYSGADGTLIWEQRFPGVINQGATVAGLAADAEGNIVVSGTIDDGDGSGAYAYTAKYAATDGHLLWSQTYHATI